VPPASAAELPPQFDRSLFNPTLMWTEYLNRLLGVTVGFLIFATFISAWRHHRREPRIFWTTVAALLLTGFQVWLGGRVVANELAAWIVTVHLIVALVIVQLLLYATVRALKRAGGPPSPLLIALIVITMIQIGLGTQVRGAVDAAINSGVAHASALASVGPLDHIHRSVALFVFAGSLLTMMWLSARFPKERTLIQWAYVVAGLAALQVALGIAMAYVSLAPATPGRASCVCQSVAWRRNRVVVACQNQPRITRISLIMQTFNPLNPSNPRQTPVGLRNLIYMLPAVL